MEYRLVTLDPSVTMVAAIATAMPDAMMAYSIAVAPPSSRRKRKASVATGSFSELRHGPWPFWLSDHNSVVRCEINGSSAGGIG